jgi:ornithine cyclodeaminase/alanine dehydrogenase-like protein (mu-crystallin family)
MQLRILTESDLRALLTMPDAIEAVREGFRQLAAGSAEIPVRTPVAGGLQGSVALFMPGRLGPSAGKPDGDAAPASAERSDGDAAPPSAALGAKVVSVFPGNRDRGRPVVQAVILLLDPQTGAPRAVLDGEWLTALRTGAATGVATDLLARSDARVLTVFGAGDQAPMQIEAVRCVRPIREVRIVSRSGRSAAALAERLTDEAGPADPTEHGRGGEGVRFTAHDDPAEALRGAEVVVTVTDSSKPVLPVGAIEPGGHINAVGGYTRQMQELPAELVARCRVVVDEMGAALAEAGDLVIPMEAGLTDHTAKENDDE